MAMLAVLTAPTCDLVARHRNVTLRTFVDDRTFTGPAEDVLQMKAEWAKWSNILGLKENASKTIFFHRTPAGRKKFCTLGMAAAQISTSPKILGCELKPAQGRTSTEREKIRLQESIHFIQKSRSLPLPWNRLFVIGQGISRGMVLETAQA